MMGKNKKNIMMKLKRQVLNEKKKRTISIHSIKKVVVDKGGK